MSFHNAQTPEDVPDYEYESDVRRLDIVTSTTEGETDANERPDQRDRGGAIESATGD